MIDASEPMAPLQWRPLCARLRAALAKLASSSPINGNLNGSSRLSRAATEPSAAMVRVGSRAIATATATAAAKVSARPEMGRGRAGQRKSLFDRKPQVDYNGGWMQMRPARQAAPPEGRARKAGNSFNCRRPPSLRASGRLAGRSSGLWMEGRFLHLIGEAALLFEQN